MKNKFTRRTSSLDKGLRSAEGESKPLASEKSERPNECMLIQETFQGEWSECREIFLKFKGNGPEVYIL